MCARSPQKFLSAEKVWWPLILRKRFPFLPLIKFIKFISFIPLWRFWCVVATNVDMWSQERNAGTFKTLTTQMVNSNLQNFNHIFKTLTTQMVSSLPIGSWTLNEDKIVRVQYCPYITILSSALPLFFCPFCCLLFTFFVFLSLKSWVMQARLLRVGGRKSSWAKEGLAHLRSSLIRWSRWKNP